MSKSTLVALLVFGQAAMLLVAGLATIWWSRDLMPWLLHQVGEEWALGAQNVIRHEDGSILLTNPGAMIRWTMPFWFLGVLQMTSAVALVGLLWSGRRAR